MELRKQIMQVGDIKRCLGGYCISVKIATQKPNGYWYLKYQNKNFISDNINKLRKIKKGQQYFGNYWGSLIN